MQVTWIVVTIWCHKLQLAEAAPGSSGGQTCNYCQIGGRPTLSNTYCQNLTTPAAGCQKVLAQGVQLDDKRLIVDAHNAYRSGIALGRAPLFRYSAANMMALSWDEELAAGAQLWANQCSFNHDIDRSVCRFAAGQNLYIAGSSGTPVKNWQKAIESWYSEVKDFKGNPSNLTWTEMMPVGHFTQLAWATTRLIGCGYMAFTGYLGQPSGLNSAYYVCNYGPAGNVIGRPMMALGTACSSCPVMARTCSSAGLCEHPESLPLPPLTPISTPTTTTLMTVETTTTAEVSTTTTPTTSLTMTTTTMATTLTATTARLPTTATIMTTAPTTDACDMKKLMKYLEACSGQL